MKLNYFNFKDLNGKVLLTNDMGKYTFVEKEEFKSIISGRVEKDSKLWKTLHDAAMIYDDSDLHFSELNCYNLREAKGYMTSATSLHIFVVTTACNMNCVYCQANNGSSTPNCFMSEEIAEKAVDIALSSPERYLNFEFQGGEPLLNFGIIKHIVEYAEHNKGSHHIEYSIVSNLTFLDEDILDFLEKNNICVSTSLDGSHEIHDLNRPFKDGSGTYEILAQKIRMVKARGLSIGAIETTTANNLHHPKEVVDAYIEMGFDSIFIRHLTQLGKAGKNWDKIGYSAEEFIDFYKDVLNTIISYNKKGNNIREQHASILLKRILGNMENYMELRSPCGGAIGQMAFFADGRIFTCDEGRMMAEMGIDAFQLGNVFNSTYESLIRSGACHAVCAASMLETIPSCCDCVYQPYCGTCPVVSYALEGDLIEKRPGSFRCRVYSGILDCLFDLLQENDEETVNILKSWCC